MVVASVSFCRWQFVTLLATQIVWLQWELLNRDLDLSSDWEQAGGTTPPHHRFYTTHNQFDFWFSNRSARGSGHEGLQELTWMLSGGKMNDVE